ncbi:MAG: DUF4214 domain-containing protein, partial [Thermoanaerobaculia bacterium]
MSVPLRKRFLNQLDSSIRRFASGRSDEAFMVRLYQEMLRRPPDVSALADGTRKLGLGLVRRNHLRQEIASSAEYRAVTPPWKCVLNQLDSSIRRFASGRSDEAFLARLYEQMLGRRPDAGALSAGTRNLSRGFLRRNNLRKQVASSAEYRAVTTLRGIKTPQSSLRRLRAPSPGKGCSSTCMETRSSAASRRR